MMIMVMRTKPPLEDRGWTALVNDLKKGPSGEQAEFIRKATDRANTLTVPCDD